MDGLARMPVLAGVVIGSAVSLPICGETGRSGPPNICLLIEDGQGAGSHRVPVALVFPARVNLFWVEREAEGAVRV